MASTSTRKRSTRKAAPAKRVRPSRARQTVVAGPSAAPEVVIEGHAMRLTRGTVNITARELATTQRNLEHERASNVALSKALEEIGLEATQRRQDQQYQRVVDERARPCPFCGLEPRLLARQGGPITSRLIVCDNSDGCAVQPSVGGNTTREALERWNTRAPAAVTLQGREIDLRAGDTVTLVE